MHERSPTPLICKAKGMTLQSDFIHQSPLFREKTVYSSLSQFTHRWYTRDRFGKNLIFWAPEKVQSVGPPQMCFTHINTRALSHKIILFPTGSGASYTNCMHWGTTTLKVLHTWWNRNMFKIEFVLDLWNKLTQRIWPRTVYGPASCFLRWKGTLEDMLCVHVLCALGASKTSRGHQ